MSENDVDFKAATGHGATCPTCGEACDIFAGNALRWPVTLPHPHEPGVIGYHHMGCVVGTIEDLSRKLEEARHRIAELEYLEKISAEADELENSETLSGYWHMFDKLVTEKGRSAAWANAYTVARATIDLTQRVFLKDARIAELEQMIREKEQSNA